MKDEKRKEVRNCGLTKEEMTDPHRVLRDFKDDISFEAVRKMLFTMRDVCSTSENIPFGPPEARDDLFYMVNRMIRFIEASYLQLGRINVQMYMGSTYTRQLTVLEKEILKKDVLKNVKNVTHTVPHIALFGQWLAAAGFHPGDEVTIVSGEKKIFITISKEWDEKSQEARARA